MSKFTFTLPNGKPFEVKGPPGLSLEQARAAFDQQVKTGSLVGLKPGAVLSAATQAAGGLSSAQSILGQAQSAITGALGAGIPGAAGAIGAISRAAGAAGGALNGSLSGIAPGLSGAVGGVIAQGATAAAAVSKIGSVASTAVSTINRTLASTPLSVPVDLVNYAKQAESLTSIGSMAQGTVTGVLAQTKNLVGQATSAISNAKGVGEFGLDVSQLERAGVVKPGMSSLVKAGASITDVLKSPAAFTGKNGVKSITDLLSNASKQSGIQQQLMSQGVNQLAAVGIPVNALNAQGLAGLATNAAKSVAGTEALLKNLGVPADVPAGFTDAFNKNIRDGAFAAKFSETKVPLPFKAEIVPVPAEQTVQRPTVDAASTRVIGNEKVPEPNYSSSTPSPGSDAQITAEIQRLATELAVLIDSTREEYEALTSKISALESQQTITDAQWQSINAERLQTVRKYNTTVVPLNGQFIETFNSAIEITRVAYLPVRTRIQNSLTTLVNNAIEINTRVKELSKKIAGTTTA
jgi:hypothetical protein